MSAKTKIAKKLFGKLIRSVGKKGGKKCLKRAMFGGFKSIAKRATGYVTAIFSAAILYKGYNLVSGVVDTLAVNANFILYALAGIFVVYYALYALKQLKKN